MLMLTDQIEREGFFEKLFGG
jgi:hypothetical protein